MGLNCEMPAKHPKDKIKTMFEYKCSKCEHKMEVLERRSGKLKHICEKCGNTEMQKIFSDFVVGQTGSSCLTGNCLSP